MATADQTHGSSGKDASRASHRGLPPVEDCYRAGRRARVAVRATAALPLGERD